MLTLKCARLLLKSIEDSFKYQVSLCELYYREQWLEKKFVFNLVSLLFDACDFLINVQLFYIIVKRGALPIYILSDVLDNLTRLGKTVMQLYKWRQFIHKLRALKDVASTEDSQLQCCICLGDINKGKQLSCSHVFHMGCLRTWLIEKAECPTCRKPIRLDKQGEERVNRRHNRMRVEQRMQERR